MSKGSELGESVGNAAASVSGQQYFERAATVETSRIAKDGLFACPCCNEYTISEVGGWEICDCGWEDDPVQEAQPDLAGGANRMSLLQARENYITTGFSDPELLTRMRRRGK